MSISIITAYGVKDVCRFLKKEFASIIEEGDTCLYELIDELEGNKDRQLLYAYYSDDISDSVGIPINIPYEKEIFKSKKECDKWIYNTLKPILKHDVTLKDLEIDLFQDYIVG